jgi:inner membrane protein
MQIPLPPAAPLLHRARFGLKAVAVAVLVILLLIPLSMIRGTIHERQAYRQQAVASVAGSHAGAQVLAAPVLVIPYVETIQVDGVDANGSAVRKSVRRERRWVHFPARAAVTGSVAPAIRRRGLHEVRVYELQAHIAADFDLVLPADPAGSREIGRPWLSLSIADVRGLAGTPALAVDGRGLRLQQGPGPGRTGGGLHAETPLAPASGQRLRFRTTLDLGLGGTEVLAIAPIADANTIALRSSWPHPQFAGRFLPRHRRIGADGFEARWEVSALAAGTQAQYLAGAETGALDALSVGLVEPVNVYSQADRASKYGLLFVLLTFAGFFLFEVLKHLRIHPIQYALVGLALAIFFLLLLSLSEHLPFRIAYLAASVACIGLLGTYLSAVLRSRARGAAFAAALTVLYGALYGLLVSEDNALVLGSLLLFAILAAGMLVTRRIDWYAAGADAPAGVAG